MLAKSLQLCPTLRDSMDYITYQAPLSMGFSRQECGSGLPWLPPGDLPDTGIEPTSLKSPVLAGSFFTTSTTWEILQRIHVSKHHVVTLIIYNFYLSIIPQ